MLVVAALQSCSSTLDKGPDDTDPPAASVQGQGTLQDNPNVSGTLTFGSGGGVLIDIKVDNNILADHRMDSVRMWSGNGVSPPGAGTGNPVLSSPEYPFKGSMPPPFWQGGTFVGTGTAPHWVLVEVVQEHTSTDAKKATIFKWAWNATDSGQTMRIPMFGSALPVPKP